jgi:hypothetical protein
MNIRVLFTRTEQTKHGLIHEADDDDDDDDTIKTRVALNPESSLDGTEKPASRPGRFTPGERTPYWIGDWMVPRTGPEAVPERKIPAPVEVNIERIWVY